jgi:probable HAF family extracellular repeat protein
MKGGSRVGFGVKFDLPVPATTWMWVCGRRESDVSVETEGWITMKNTNRVAVVALLAAFSVGAFAQAVFNIIAVPGASPNTLIAINNAGQVLVNGGNQVSVWGRIGGTQNLVMSGTNSRGADINNSGEVAGAGDPSQATLLQAFVWQASGGSRWLGSLGSGYSIASGLSDQGSIVGLSYTATNQQHAFLWQALSGMRDLTPDVSNTGGATATAINSSDEVAGYYFPNGSVNTLGFLWTQAGGLEDLGSAGTLAFGIDDTGKVVGQMLVANGYRHAFSWTKAGGFVDLGTLGGSSSSATSMNGLGWILGTSQTTSNNGIQHGFLWTAGGGMKDLNSMAPLAPKNQQTYSLQANDFGVIAISSNKGGFLLSPKISVKIKSSVDPSVSGQAVTFTATLTSLAGAPPDGEMVQFTNNGAALGTATVQGGMAQLTTSTLTLGRHNIVATYVGDENYLPVVSLKINQVVNQ